MERRKFAIRAVERPHIISVRRKEFSALYTGKDGAFELRSTEFLLIAALYQLNITYVCMFFDLAMKHGPILVCISYAFLTAVLGMPLFMLFVFMSSYSKKSYFAFWECVPLFKGLGYSLPIMRMFLETNNVAMAAFALLLLFNYFTGNLEKGFRKCVYNTTIDCTGMFPSQEVKNNCTNSIMQVHTASQSFTRYVETKYSTVIIKDFLNVEWLILVGIVWLVVFLMSIHGIRHVKKITINIQIFCGVIILFVCLFTMTHIPWSTISETRLLERERGTTALNFNFWVDMVMHCAEINTVSFMIWLGTLKPKSLQPKHAAIMICPLKLVVFIMLKCLSLCIVKENIIHYKYKDYTCFKYDSKDFLFIFMPDILFRTNIYTLFVPLWYVSLFCFAFCAPLYSVIGLVDSVVQKNPSLCKYKLYLHLAICAGCFLMTALMTTSFANEMLKTWLECSLPVITSMMLLLVNLAILFIYTTKEVVIDHMFTYGRAPEKYWTTLWKTAPLFAMFGFILVTHHEYTNAKCAEFSVAVILTHLSTALVLLPVIMVFVTTCFKHIRDRALQSLSRPSDKWGPYDPMERFEKELFFPQRDIRYRNENLKCEHKCVVRKHTDTNFQIFLSEQHHKLLQLEAEYHSSSNYKETSQS